MGCPGARVYEERRQDLESAASELETKIVDLQTAEKIVEALEAAKSKGLLDRHPVVKKARKHLQQTDNYDEIVQKQLEDLGKQKEELERALRESEKEKSELQARNRQLEEERNKYQRLAEKQLTVVGKLEEKGKQRKKTRGER